MNFQKSNIFFSKKVSRSQGNCLGHRDFIDGGFGPLPWCPFYSWMCEHKPLSKFAGQSPNQVGELENEVFIPCRQTYLGAICHHLYSSLRDANCPPTKRPLRNLRQKSPGFLWRDTWRVEKPTSLIGKR